MHVLMEYLHVYTYMYMYMWYVVHCMYTDVVPEVRGSEGLVGESLKCPLE